MLEAILNYFQTTPYEVMALHALFVVAPFPIFGVMFWGFLEVWKDNRQGIYASKMKWQLLQVSVPADSIQTPKGMENFFAALYGAKSGPTWKEEWLDGKFQTWFSFEIVSIGGDIRFYIRCVQKYRDMIEAALYAQYPEAQISEVDDYVDIIPSEYPDDNWDIWGSEMKLSRPSELPIRTWMDFEHQGEKDQRLKDPLLPMLEGLGKMLPGEVYCIQLMIMPPLEQDWRQAGIDRLNEAYGKGGKPKSSGGFGKEALWFPVEMINQITGGDLHGGDAGDASGDDFAAFRIPPHEKEELDGIARKISKIGFYTKIRFVYAAKKELFRKGTVASMTKGIFQQYGHLGLNKFGIHGPATPKDDYFWQEWEMPKKQTSIAKRYKDRSFGSGGNPFILNTEELATLFHFPAADARTPVLTSLGSRRAEAPQELQFAAADAPDLPNIDFEDQTPKLQSNAPAQQRKLAVPHPMAPTSMGESEPSTSIHGTEAHAPAPASPVAPSPMHDESMPQPGMPAPLPPGLDLADEPIDPEEHPPNLPL